MIRELEEIAEYSFDIFTDYLLFSDNIEDELIENDKIFLKIEYLKFLDYQIKEIIKNNIYPKKCIINLEKIINYIGKLLSNDVTEEYKDMYYLISGRLSNNQITESYEIYNLEFEKKFYDFSFYKNYSTHILSKDFLETSIRNDYIVLLSFAMDDNSYLSCVDDFTNNQFYLLSIRKFLYDQPDLFLDEGIRKMVLTVLKINNELFSENLDKEENKKFINENQKLMDCIQNINKKNLYHIFDIRTFKYYFDLTLLKYLLSSNDNSFKNNEKWIYTEHFLDFIEQFIEDEEDIIDENIKYRLDYLIRDIRDFIGNNEVKQKVNLIKSKLHELDSYEKINSLYFKDAKIKYNLKQILSTAIYCLFYEKEEFVEEMKITMKYDFELLSSYLLDDEIFQNFVKEDFFLNEQFICSLKLFLKEYPYMFASDEIMNKTLMILNHNINQLKKEDFSLVVYEMKKEHQKILKRMERIKY